MSDAKHVEAPSGGWARWVILMMTCLGLFGQFYAFDNPSALNEQLKLHMTETTGVSNQEYAYYFNLLYSSYSMPNVVLPLIMGLAVDRCGCRLLICMLSGFVVVGHCCFALGVGSSSWKMMICGRIIFGLGGESLQVAQNCLLFRWFSGREIAFALGANLSVARAGSVLNDVLSPWAAQQGHVTRAMWVGAALCMGSFAANVWSVVLDYTEGDRMGRPEVSEEHVSFLNIFKLRRRFWLLVALCVTLYCAILPFNNVASAFFVETWFKHLPLADAQQQAGNAMAIIFLVSAFGTPPLGGIVDIFGQRTHLLFLSSVLVVVTYATIFALPPTFSMLCLGLVYTIFAATLWPALALSVPQAQLGTAYGVAMSLQNGGLAVTPMLVAHLQAINGQGQFGSIVRLFLMLGIVGTGLAMLIHQENRDTNGVLNLPSAEAERRGQDQSGKKAEAMPVRDIGYGQRMNYT